MHYASFVLANSLNHLFVINCMLKRASDKNIKFTEKRLVETWKN
jgi:hypothetical protein